MYLRLTFPLLILITIAFAVPVSPVRVMAATGQRGYSFTPSVYFQADVSKNDEAKSTPSLLAVDARIGHSFKKGFYSGLIYSLEDSFDGLYHQTFSGYGISLGYARFGFLLLGHYYLSGKQDLLKEKNSPIGVGGQGYGADLGYQLNVAEWFSIGVQLSYKSMTYTQDQLDNEIDASFSDVRPFLSLGFRFR